MEADITIRGYNRNLIDCMIKEVHGEREWRFILFNGDLVVSNRHVTWELLKGLSQDPDAPWVVGGDFNEVLSNEEKTGAPRPERQMMAFRETLDECGLRDLGFNGHKFT